MSWSVVRRLLTVIAVLSGLGVSSPAFATAPITVDPGVPYARVDPLQTSDI